MQKNKKSIYQTALEEVSGDAKLLVNTDQVKDNVGKRNIRTKTLKAIPAIYFDAHQKLRNNNKTILDFSNYIMEAIREKLEKDGAL